MPDHIKVDKNGNELDVVQAYRKWVEFKHNSWHPITQRNKTPRRVISWERLPSKKPSFIKSI